jgi:hypothetical protein
MNRGKRNERQIGLLLLFDLKAGSRTSLIALPIVAALEGRWLEKL